MYDNTASVSATTAQVLVQILPFFAWGLIVAGGITAVSIMLDGELSKAKVSFSTSVCGLAMLIVSIVVGNAVAHTDSRSITPIVVATCIVVASGVLLVVSYFRRKSAEDNDDYDAHHESHPDDNDTTDTQSEVSSRHGGSSQKSTTTTRLEALQSGIKSHLHYWTKGVVDAIKKLTDYSHSGYPISAKLQRDIDYLLERFESVIENYKMFSSFATDKLY